MLGTWYPEMFRRNTVINQLRTWCSPNVENNILSLISAIIFPKLLTLLYPVHPVAVGCDLSKSPCGTKCIDVQYIPRNMHAVFALLCFVVVIHWLIFPYPSGLLHWHCGNLTIAPVPAKQPWWIWINTSCELIMKGCITTTKQSTTKPCAYFLGYTVSQQYKIAWRTVGRHSCKTILFHS